MISVKMKMKDTGIEVPVGDIKLGESGTFTDYTHPNTEIVMVQCLDDCGKVSVSKAGFTVDINPQQRILESDDLRLEKTFMDEYERPIKTKFGDAILILKLN